MSQAIAFEALAAHTKAFTNETPTAWPNVDFKRPASGQFYRVQSFPTEANQVELGDAGRNRFRGLWQVSVYVPEGQGLRKGLATAQEAADHFKRGTVLEGASGIIVRILKPPVIGPSITEPPYVQIPVTIEYQFDAANP